MSILSKNPTKENDKKTTAFNNDPTILGNSVKLKGDIECNGDIRIDGELVGNLICKGRLVLGNKGRIEGDIDCKSAEISGTLVGKVQVQDKLSLTSTAHVTGDMVVGKLSVDNAVFNGNCKIKGTSTAS